MNATSTAAALLKGSSNLDLMRDQIAKLVKLLINLITADDGALLHEMLKITRVETLSGRWSMGTCRNALSTQLRPYFTYSKRTGTDDYFTIYSSDPTDGLGLQMESVQIVWEDLPALVDGITKALPKIQGSRWQALLNAAQVTVPS